MFLCPVSERNPLEMKVAISARAENPCPVSETGLRFSEKSAPAVAPAESPADKRKVSMRIDCVFPSQ